MSDTAPRRPTSLRGDDPGWVRDVLCGIMGGFLIAGWAGAVCGALFMGSVGQRFRDRHRRREIHLRAMQVRSAMRRRAGARSESPSGR